MRMLGLALVVALAGCGSSAHELQDPVFTRGNGSGPREADRVVPDAPADPRGAGSVSAPVSASAAPSPSGSAKAPPAASGKPAAPPPLPLLLTADTDPARLDGGVASPGVSPAKVPCGALFGAGSAYCIKATEGPFVVTDLQTSPGCPNEIFVAAGSSTSPRWALLSTSSTPLSVHGGRLVVKSDEFLFVGAQAASLPKISTDARCSVVWSGFRPYTGAGDPREVPRDLGF